MNYGGNRVDYYHCLDCHHVWNIPKGEQGPVNHVTPLPTQKPMTMSALPDDLFVRAERAINERRRLSLDASRLRRQSVELALHASELFKACCELFDAAERSVRGESEGQTLNAA